LGFGIWGLWFGVLGLGFGVYTALVAAPEEEDGVMPHAGVISEADRFCPAISVFKDLKIRVDKD